MKCAEIMTMNPQMCVPEDEVAVAISLMWDHDCGAIPVVMDSESKKLVGIVTDRDIAMHVVKHACLHPSQAKVSDCMVTSVITCQPEDSVEMAIKLMSEYQVRRIPIVDENGSCMGIISEADLLLRAIDVKSEYMKPVLTALQQISAPCSNVNLVESVEPAADVAKDKVPVATVSE
jgi:CBS domain-containing protein